jgi:hypothetical protein
MRDKATSYGRPDRMQPKLERCCHSEIAAAAANGPEEVGLFFQARLRYFAVGGDELDGQQVVECQTVFAHQPPQPAAEGQPGDTGGRHDTARHGQAVQLGLSVQFSPSNAALCMHRAASDIHTDTPHRRQVDHQPVLDRGSACDVVTAASNGDFQIKLTRQVYDIGNVGHTPTTSNQRRPLVNQAVMNLSCLIVALVGWQ